MKVLIVKISSMGDIIHTLPALSDAVIYCESIEFDWVVEENFIEIPYWHHAVKNVIPVAIRRWKKTWFKKSTQYEKNIFYEKLQQYNYDIIIDVQGLIKSAFYITRHAHGKSHGFNWSSAREPLASIFYDYCYNIKKQQHAIDRIRKLFAYSLCYKDKVKNDINYGISDFFFKQSQQKTSTLYIIFFHNTTYYKKLWPECYWRELIYKINKHNLIVKLPWLTYLEYQRALRLQIGFTHVQILPQSTLKQIADIINSSIAVISVDTGLSHLTAALGKFNISLYGPTNPKFIGCYGKSQEIIISNNGHMDNIKPQEVYKRLISKILKKY